jgi:hypothetical protein
MAMTSREGDTSQSREVIFVPVARARALTHALVWLVPAFVIFTFSWTFVAGPDTILNVRDPGIVDVALLLVLVPFNLLALGLGVWGLRWLLLSLWPGTVGVQARAEELVLAFGPFGSRRYPAAELDVRYLFELDDDEAEEGFEAFLPEDEQIRMFLPRIGHPSVREPLNRVMLRYVAGPESSVAQRLRPVVARWRGEDEHAEPDA